jgi:ABC-2 type transport system permease protein
MALISAGFIGLGLIFASILKDIQGFGIIMQLIIMPLIFLSGAIFPLSNLPRFLRYISYLDPLTYGVESLRRVLVGYCFLPSWLNFFATFLFPITTVFLGAFFFEKSEV